MEDYASELPPLTMQLNNTANCQVTGTLWLNAGSMKSMMTMVVSQEATDPALATNPRRETTEQPTIVPQRISTGGPSACPKDIVCDAVDTFG